MTIIRCDHCKMTLFAVEDGRRIIVKAKHHGKQHLTVVRIEDLTTDKGRATIPAAIDEAGDLILGRQRVHT